MIVDVSEDRDKVGALVEAKHPMDIQWACLGMTSVHNMPCAVIPSQHAVHVGNTGVFHPSWEAQREGWVLRRVRPGRQWLFNLMQCFVFDRKYGS